MLNNQPQMHLKLLQKEKTVETTRDLIGNEMVKKSHKNYHKILQKR